MKKATVLWLFMLVTSYSYSQFDSDDYNVTVIDKTVSEFPLQIDLSTPLNYEISREYIFWSGKAGLWDAISGYKHMGFFDPQAPDTEVSEERKKEILDKVIKEVIVYKDSAAAIICYDGSGSQYGISYAYLEDGNWVNAGDNSKRTIEGAREDAARLIHYSYANSVMAARLKQLPQDTRPFLDYVQKKGEEPKQFVLDALATHKIVVYGEHHKRKVSWDLLQQLVMDPQFAETTGTVFLELNAYMQPVMDELFEKEVLDTKLLLQLLDAEHPIGWCDKGMYEFLIQLWKLNKTLTKLQKINVVLVDIRTPYALVKTKEDIEKYPLADRNTYMADVIEKHIRSSSDQRNNLFIVGYAHAYKSEASGLDTNKRTTGAQLAGRFSDDNVFTIYQHSFKVDNKGKGKVRLAREGFFDRVFEEAGNIPVAFKLKNSPFGEEPFDGVVEIELSIKTGTYANNYDGYIFLYPLKQELIDYGYNYILYEMFTEEFVEEVKKRAEYMGMPRNLKYWFRMSVDEMTAERIKAFYRKDWEDRRKTFLKELFGENM